MNAQITQISNGYLVTVVSGPQQNTDVLNNVKYISELHEIKGAITELTENLERAQRQASEARLASMVRANEDAAKVALSEGPRN